MRTTYACRRCHRGLLGAIEGTCMSQWPVFMHAGYTCIAIAPVAATEHDRRVRSRGNRVTCRAVSQAPQQFVSCFADPAARFHQSEGRHMCTGCPRAPQLAV